MKIKVISTGQIILADESFADAVHPNDWEAVAEEPTTVPVVPMSVLEFRSRFTQSEKQAIYTAAKTSVDVQIWLDDLAAASDVKTDDQRTIDGVNALEAAGLIGAGRAAEILA